MALMKVIEVLAESEKGWEDATQKALEEASKTIQNIRSIYIKEFTAHVVSGKIDKYRVNAKVTFQVERKG